MQSIHTMIRRLPRQVHHKNNTMSTRYLTNMPRAMSLFPRFAQDFAPVFRMFDDYDRQTFSNFDRQFNRITSFNPKFDVKETKSGYELHGELPGIEQKDINIEWTNHNTLTISGRHEHAREEAHAPASESNESPAPKKLENQPIVEDEAAEPNTSTESQPVQQSQQLDAAKQEDTPKEKYWVIERTVGEFHRTFTFPVGVDQDAVKASLKNGILSILIPREATSQPKKVQIA